MASLTSYVLLTEPPKEDSPNKDWKMYPKLEQQWSNIRFDAVDVLHICPFNAWLKGNKYVFGILDNCTEQNPAGDLAERFEWVIRQARHMNPNIKIIAMQMHNGGDYSKLKNNVDDYSTSVANLMKAYLHKTTPSKWGGEDIKMHIDGYDVDYEWAGDDNSLGSGNYQTYSADIIAAVRTKIDKVDSTHKFYTSISAANTTGLPGRRVAQYLDYVKMQNYDGGVRDPDYYLGAANHGGLGPSLKLQKLVYGISTEWSAHNDYDKLPDVVNLVKTKNYAGVMTWRLNSDVLLYENAVQVYLYNQLRSPAIKPDHSDDDVISWWWKEPLRTTGSRLGGRIWDDAKLDKDGNQGDWAVAAPWKLS